MATLKELQSLREEEKALILIHSKMSDQLNRLKVEELALLSQLRTQSRTSTLTEDTTSQSTMLDADKDDEEVSLQQQALDDLDLATGNLLQTQDQEEEEEEDSDTGDTGYERQKYDDLAAFIEHLSKNQNNKDT